MLVGYGGVGCCLVLVVFCLLVVVVVYCLSVVLLLVGAIVFVVRRVPITV